MILQLYQSFYGGVEFRRDIRVAKPSIDKQRFVPNHYVKFMGDSLRFAE